MILKIENQPHKPGKAVQENNWRELPPVEWTPGKDPLYLVVHSYNHEGEELLTTFRVTATELTELP